MTTNKENLLPCPFCGCALDAHWDRPNPKARCLTEGCKGRQLPVLNLDVPGDIAAWNTRIHPTPTAAAPTIRDSLMVGGEAGTAFRAITTLKTIMQADSDLAWTWHCGIWSASYDEGVDSDIANRAAARVMHMAFGVDTSKHEHFAQALRPSAPPASVEAGAVAVVSPEGIADLVKQAKLIPAALSSREAYTLTGLQIAWIAGKLRQAALPEPADAEVMTDARINDITMNKLGQWPSFEAQSWACKVVHAVLAAPPAESAQPAALAAENTRLREALKFYADRDHFLIADKDAWDTVSGEPQNLWCDEAGTATVEDGSIAKVALGAQPTAATADAQGDERAEAEVELCRYCDLPVEAPGYCGCNGACYAREHRATLSRQPSAGDALQVRRDTLLSVLGSLNSNPYSLTKTECTDLVREMFNKADAAIAATKPEVGSHE